MHKKMPQAGFELVAIRPRAWLLSTEVNWHKNDRAKKCENDFF